MSSDSPRQLVSDCCDSAGSLRTSQVLCEYLYFYFNFSSGSFFQKVKMQEKVKNTEPIEL